MSHDLFPQLPLREWLPDELLFSWPSRHHLVSGNAKPSATCLQLFGHRHRGSAHDFPSRIDEFVRRTGGRLGTAEAVIRDHTTLPFYLPFRSPLQATDAIAAMRGDGDSRYSLWLLASRFRRQRTLKACCTCMENDQRRYTVAYWHRVHQVPGVVMCPHHGEPLWWSTLNFHGGDHFAWHLPSRSALQPVRLPEGTLAQATKLTRMANAFLGVPPGLHFDPEALSRSYAAALASHGYASAAGVEHSKIAEAYAEHLSPLQGLDEVREAVGDGDIQRHVRSLLHGRRGALHPLLHVLFIDWLFDDHKAFLRCYRRESEEADEQRAGAQETDDASSLPERALLAINEGMSPTAISRELGVDPATVMAWASKAGLVSRRRPKRIKGDLRQQLLDGLRRGEEKQDLVAQLGVSEPTVTRLLRTEVGLREAWSTARVDRARRQARVAWSELARNNPASGPKYLRLVEPAVYAWLYRNDQPWLQDTNRAIEARTRSAALSRVVCLSENDRRLAQELRAALLQIARHSPTGRLTLAQIHLALPDLKRQMANLDKIPVTMAVLSRALANQPRFASERDDAELPLSPEN
jgi:hypothetical protein